MVPASKIRIKLTAFDHRVLMESVEEIVKTAKRTGADVVGPVRLPTLVQKFTPAPPIRCGQRHRGRRSGAYPFQRW